MTLLLPHWYADAVQYVTDKGLMNGTDDNQFSPNASTTRGMLMTVLARYAGEDTTGGAIWYEKGMNWAKANGVSDGTNPNANITREQLVTMMYRYAGSPKADGKLDSFSDCCKRQQLRSRCNAVGSCQRHCQWLERQAEPAG
ncbi:MAG: S-layer homology domain-containing protein [Butyricicoccaceae bacterium]